MRSLFLGAFVFGIAVFAAASARADSVNFYGDGTVEHFTGSASFDGTYLDISLKNNSIGSPAPSITAFYFNSVDDSVVLTPDSPGGTVDPFGSYKFGVTVSGGIAGQQTESFRFTVSGSQPSSVRNFFTKGGSLAAGEPLVASFSNGINVGDSVEEAPLPATASCGIALLGALGLGRHSLKRRAAAAKK